MLEQLAIALFGATAVWLSQDESSANQKLACIFGLIGQPFWFWATFHAEQWGMFALCFLYTAAWWRGFERHWLQQVRMKLRDWMRGYTDNDLISAREKMMFQEPGNFVHMTEAECKALGENGFSIQGQDQMNLDASRRLHSLTSIGGAESFGKTTYKDPNWNWNKNVD